MNAVDWLLSADPAIRWQALRDLTDTPAEQVAAERARVATEGWAARLLALQADDGLWHTDDPDAEWISLLALLQLRDMGLDPHSQPAQAAVTGVRDNAVWNAQGEWHGNPVFAGEVEPCINGRVLAVGAYFGLDMSALVERLLGEQMADGGWNCEQENGSTRGSFDSSINVLEGLLEFQQSTGGSAEVGAALVRGQEYLLERRLLRRLSDGQQIKPGYDLLSYPTGWHYDLLRGLEHLRAAAVAPDARMAEAIELLRAKQDSAGRLPIEKVHPYELVRERIGQLEFGMPHETEGEPSLWNTLRGLRVLRWYDGA